MSETLAATRGPKENARAHGANSYPSLDEDNIFSGCVTLDPSEVESAWSRLSSNVWAMQLGEIPLLMHHALLRTLETSKIVEWRE